MISSWRRRRETRRLGKDDRRRREKGDMEIIIPNHFRCPISLDLMKDPVTLSTGITYDRESIETWIEAGNFTCPITNQVLRSLEPVPNHSIRKMIQEWCVQNQSRGIERIPTPRIPVSSMEVSDILSNIEETIKRDDPGRCRDLVAKIKALAKESERNKRCIGANGAVSSLSAAFGTFSSSKSGDFDKNIPVLEDILSALTLINFPLDEESRTYLSSPSSLHCMIKFMRNGDLSGRSNSVLVLKNLIVSQENQIVSNLQEINGALESLLKLIKDPFTPTATNASLTIIYHIIINSNSSSPSKAVQDMIKNGLVSSILEILVDAERSICEKSLGVLDGICNSQEGREKAYDHALTMPVLVKKILRVSELATEFLVSIIWKLSKNEKREGGGVMVEALQLGAFQKLLLLLQVGCSEEIKVKVSELLKLLNLSRDKLECIDSLDFKDLKRPF